MGKYFDILLPVNPMSYCALQQSIGKSMKQGTNNFARSWRKSFVRSRSASPGPGSIATPGGGGGGSKPVSQTLPPYWALGAGPTKVTPHTHSKHHKCTAPPPFGESAALTGSNHLAPRWGRGLPLSDALPTAFSRVS